MLYDVEVQRNTITMYSCTIAASNLIEFNRVQLLRIKYVDATSGRLAWDESEVCFFHFVIMAHDNDCQRASLDLPVKLYLNVRTYRRDIVQFIESMGLERKSWYMLELFNRAKLYGTFSMWWAHNGVGNCA